MSKEASREKIIERIRKCLALGKSSNPHEAAAAIRQAQKLMEKHGIDTDALLMGSVTEEIVVTGERWRRRNKWPQYIMGMCAVIATAFGVEMIFELVRVPRKGAQYYLYTNEEGVDVYQNDERLGIRYFGTGNGPLLAKYTHEVVWRAMQDAWRQYMKCMEREALPGERANFWRGWQASVYRQIEAFAHPPEVNDAIKRKMDEHTGEDTPEASMIEAEENRELLRAGAAAGKRFSIHRPVGGTTSEAPGIEVDH